MQDYLKKAVASREQFAKGAINKADYDACIGACVKALGAWEIVSATKLRQSESNISAEGGILLTDKATSELVMPSWLSSAFYSVTDNAKKLADITAMRQDKASAKRSAMLSDIKSNILSGIELGQALSK